MIVRPVLPKDLEDIEDLDISYSTDRVWQMEQKATAEEVITTFRAIQLPRSFKVGTRPEKGWASDHKEGGLFIVAEEDQKLRGYLQLELVRGEDLMRICHLAVAPKKRRQGVGMTLLQEAKTWSKERRVRSLLVETLTRNYPAISFFEKSGFSFCGFNDSYYSNKDIAVFFVCNLI